MLSLLAQHWKPALLALLCAAAFWGVPLCQPGHQLQRHQKRLLEAAGNRDLQTLKALLDDGFRTSGGFDRTTTLQQTAEILRYFFSLQISASGEQTAREGSMAKITARLTLEGKGLPFAEAVKTMVNESQAPFVFIWERKSWKPWDWRLQFVGHPLIDRAAGGEWLF